MGIIDSQEPAYREEREIDVLIELVDELQSLIRDMMELDQMRHYAFSWERQEKAWNLRGSINARLIKMGFVKEVGE